MSAQSEYRAEVAGRHRDALAALEAGEFMGALEECEGESMAVDPADADDGEPSVAQGSARGPVEDTAEDPIARVRALLGGARHKLKITTVGDKVVLEPEPEKKAPVVEGVTMGKQL